MPTAVENIPRTQISTLENGLKNLRLSKLMKSREMKDMYDAIEKHHRDIRLAHLTGKPKDLLEQAKRDTKFFFILVKLLNESLNGTRFEQQENLREVYSWYVGNKHTLASAPRFGKQNEKKKTTKSFPSPGSRPVSGLNRLGHVTNTANKALEKDYSEELRELAGPPITTEEELLQYQQRKAASPDASAHRPSSTSLSAYRSEVGSPDSSATKRLSEPHQHLLPKRQTRALAHLYNPHSRDFGAAKPESGHDDNENIPARFSIHTYDARDTARSTLTSDLRSTYLKKWDDFQQQVAIGQDTLNKLQHCGRTGVAGGQRYVAHECGLAAEEFTSSVIATVANVDEEQQKDVPEKDTEEPLVPIEKQTLEDFYQTTQGYYPSKLPKYPNFRLRSAPSATRQMTATPVGTGGRLHSSSLVGFSLPKESESSDETLSVKSQDLAINLSGLASERAGSPENVRLDTVVTMIDSVTDEMTFFKEKLIPEPMPSFKTPTVEVDPDERPQTAPSLGTFARPSSPLDAHEEWQATPAGGHAYYRKASARSGSRSAGKGPSGSRPKTAPQTPRERWNSAAPNDENKKANVAASHTTTEVDQDVTDTMFAVRRLGGKNAKHRRYRYFFDYRPDSREYSRSAMTTPAKEYLTFIAPKPVAGSRASSAVTRSRMGSAMDGQYQVEDEDGCEDRPEEDDDSLSADLDLPTVDDLDDDLDDDFQYEGDAPLSGDEDAGVKDDAPLAEAAPASPALDQASSPQLHYPDHHDLDVQLDPPNGDGPSDDGDQHSAGLDEEEEEDQDFDSVCIRSSTQESDLDVDKQCTESRQLINEIETLVTSKRERRPVSSHSRVTFLEEPAENTEPKEPPNEQGRKILKPKSILVPRHIQPPPSVGLTIVQFQRGGGDNNEQGIATQRAFHTPTSAPRSGRSRQVLSQSQHWSCDPSDITNTEYNQHTSTSSSQFKLDVPNKLSPSTPNNTARSLGLADLHNSRDNSEAAHVPATPSTETSHPKPRLYRRVFPKTQVPNVEFDYGLKVEGKCGAHRSKSAHGHAPVTQRSAGVSPIRARSASHLRMIQKQQFMLKKAPATANRSAPSIPSVQDAQSRLPAQGPFSVEHDSHAKKERSPRKYMEKVGVLRKTDWVSSSARQGREGYLTTALRVSGMQPSSRAGGSPDQPAGHPGTPVNSFADPDRISEKSEESDGMPLDVQCSIPLTPGSTSRSTGTGSRLYIYSGRPIPEYASVKTPEETQAADQMQKQAAAAVNIQKNFRGYVARKNYKYLLREDRHRREDRQLAALHIQRTYRRHLARTRHIYARPIVKPETLQWAREFKQIQEEKSMIRSAKAAERAMENNIHKAKTEATLSIIGPHVEVYMPFHPKKTGAKKETLNAAATCIQRHLKGWLVRKKFYDIKRKAKQHANSWGRFMQQYRELIRRIQVRHGITRPKLPFSFQQVSHFMDLKKMYESKYMKVASSGYESAFESHAYAGELELVELQEYFRECDLYPVQSDIDEAFDLVFRGQQIKKGLQKHQVLELTFQLYPPPATGITNARKSTWTNPIIDGEEGNKLIGSELIEDTDFGTAFKVVASSIRERKEREARVLAAKEEADVKAKLEALKTIPRRKSSTMQALQEEDEKSTTCSDKEESVDTTGKPKDKRVTFTDDVKECAGNNA